MKLCSLNKAVYFSIKKTNKLCCSKISLRKCVFKTTKKKKKKKGEIMARFEEIAPARREFEKLGTVIFYVLMLPA